MNLHITHDNIFIDYIFNISQLLKVSEDRLVVYTFDDNELKKVKSKSVLFAKHNSEKFQEIIGDLNQYRNIYVHWLEGPAVDFVNLVPQGINVIWCFWGGDGLELPHIQKNIFQPQSLKYFETHTVSSLLDDLNPKAFYSNLKKKYRGKLAYKNHLRAIKRVDYFAHYLKEDFEIVKAATEMKAEFVPFHYGAVEDVVPADEVEMQGSNRNILLGNSDTLSNNHFEAIDLLAQVNLQDAKVYCPLSYEAGSYAKDVASYGMKKLGEKFIPLLEFLPKADYDQILSETGCAIMNHNRSQALGNICVLLWEGARLFMSEQSSLFHYLKENNCIVYSLQSDLSSKEFDFLSKLNEEELLHNRKVLLNLFGREHQMEKIKSLLTI